MWHLTKLTTTSILLYLSCHAYAQDAALCKALDPNQSSDLGRATNCISAISETLDIEICDGLNDQTPGILPKAAICGGKVAGQYLDLESRRQKLANAMEREIANRDGQISVLEKKVLDVKITAWHTFSTGEYDGPAMFRPRHYCGHDVKAEARRLCGNAEANLKLLSDRAGHKCGYADYVVACIAR